MIRSRWWRIGGSLAAGLFVAYLDRTNLSVAIPSVAKDLGFGGERFAVIGSWALTIFLVGYGLANIAGGLLTARRDPKFTVIACFAIWSVATVIVALTHSVTVLLVCRFILGMAEGVYWPQQSRFVNAWFDPRERTRANAVVQYSGQYLALAIGFMVLMPIYRALGWRPLFLITGALGLITIVPLYVAWLPREADAPHVRREAQATTRPLTLTSLGGPAFLLLVFSYLTQAMLFWGITLWIPLAVASLGYANSAQSIAASLPYLTALLLAVPVSRLSDRIGRRTEVAAFGLLVPGAILMLLPHLQSGDAKLAVITITLGLYASSYSPNIWSIVQSSVEPAAVSAAAGIINGIGAAGGALAGFMVGLMVRSTGSYVVAFAGLGVLVILGGLSLLGFARIKRSGCG
jgi:MFS family permease